MEFSPRILALIFISQNAADGIFSTLAQLQPLVMVGSPL
jgi:hypothetical protein